MMTSERSARDENETSSDNGANGQDDSRRNVAEWVTFGVSALIVAALIGAALVEYFLLDESQGVQVEVTVASDQARQVGDVFYVPFTVRNRGSQGAENVKVTFTVLNGELTLEESTTEIAFLANSGTSQGELVTKYDPATHTIEARVSVLATP